MSELRVASPLKGFLAGGFGGMCSVLVGYPLDTVKIRLQTALSIKFVSSTPPSAAVYTGTYDCMAKIVKTEGLGGFYKGMGSPICVVPVILAFNFYGFNLARSLQQKYVGETLAYRHLFAAGMLSGLFPILVSVPVERIKCLLQVQQSSTTAARFSGQFDCVRKLYREGGLRNLYRGASATMIRDVPSLGVYFTVYEYLQNTLGNDKSRHGQRNFFTTVLAGGLAGMSFWTAALPADGLKSRIQTAPAGTYPEGMRSAVKEVLMKEGPRGFYKGLAPVLLRSFPSNAGLFVGYELMMQFLHYVDKGLTGVDGS